MRASPPLYQQQVLTRFSCLHQLQVGPSAPFPRPVWRRVLGDQVLPPEQGPVPVQGAPCAGLRGRGQRRGQPGRGRGTTGTTKLLCKLKIIIFVVSWPLKKSAAHSTRCSRGLCPQDAMQPAGLSQGSRDRASTVPEPLSGIGGALVPSRHLSPKKASLPSNWGIHHSNLKHTLTRLGVMFEKGILPAWLIKM